MLTSAEENYLKALWHLGCATSEVSMQALVQAMRLSAPSVTEMAKRLAEKKFLEYRPYRGVRFTADGEALAVRIVRRHRIWEAFVAQVLGYTGNRVHELAEKLEHLSDDEFTERLYAYIGRPARDPHGDEIPPLPEAQDLIPLTRLREKQTGRLHLVPQTPPLSTLVHHFALQIGDYLQVLAFLPVDGLVLVERSQTQLLLPPSLAEHLWVEIVK